MKSICRSSNSAPPFAPSQTHFCSPIHIRYQHARLSLAVAVLLARRFTMRIAIIINEAHSGGGRIEAIKNMRKCILFVGWIVEGRI